MSRVIELDVDSFYDVINSEKPVFIDFWAEWCAPCKVIEPILQRLAEKYYEKIIFCRINVDRHPEIARIHEVMSIPTFIIFHKGKEIKRLVGALPMHVIEMEIQKILEMVGQL